MKPISTTAPGPSTKYWQRKRTSNKMHRLHPTNRAVLGKHLQSGAGDVPETNFSL